MERIRIRSFLIRFCTVSTFDLIMLAGGPRDDYNFSRTWDLIVQPGTYVCWHFLGTSSLNSN